MHCIKVENDLFGRAFIFTNLKEKVVLIYSVNVKNLDHKSPEC